MIIKFTKLPVEPRRTEVHGKPRQPLKEHYVSSYDLKKFFTNFFSNDTFNIGVPQVWVDDGGDGCDQRLVSFEVSYNTCYHFYDMSFIGGTKWKEKAEAVRKYFEDHGHRVTETSTWKWPPRTDLSNTDPDREPHRGIRYFIYAL